MDEPLVQQTVDDLSICVFIICLCFIQTGSIELRDLIEVTLEHHASSVFSVFAERLS